MTKRALITGITGQDGSYLAEFLLSRGYEVHGLLRRASTFNTRRIDHIYQDPHNPKARLFLHYGDITCGEPLSLLVYNLIPQEIYLLGAQSHVKVSFEIPTYTGEATALATTRVLEVLRQTGVRARIYQASSSEMFGSTPPPQNECSPFRPRSPYGVAKVYSHWMVVNYREAYNFFACNGILFNHESPRRGETFVTRKVTRAVAQIFAGKQEKLYLGNLEGRRDWGYAPEYVEGMWLMLQQEEPDDYVLGTGEAHSVRELVEEAFSYVGLDWREHVEVDPRYFRPTEVDYLRADATKARKVLGWAPRLRFRELVRVMVDADLEAAGLNPIGEGRAILKENFSDWHQWGEAVSRNIQSVAASLQY